MKPNMKKIGFVAALALLAVASPVPGQVSVSNENLIYNFEEGSGASGGFTTGAVYSSTVDGLAYLFAETFWLRMDGDSQEYIAGLSTFSTPATNILKAVYTNEFVSLTSTWTLTGGPAGSYTSLVTQTVSISNLSLAAASGVFYALFDFDLSSVDSGDNYLSAVGANGFRNSASSDVWLSVLFSNSLAANQWEAGDKSDIETSLNNDSVTTLSNAVTGNITNDGTGVDFGIAYVWAFSLNAGDALDFTMTWETTIPEPASWMALLGAFALFALLRRRAAARR